MLASFLYTWSSYVLMKLAECQKTTKNHLGILGKGPTVIDCVDESLQLCQHEANCYCLQRESFPERFRK